MHLREDYPDKTYTNNRIYCMLSLVPHFIHAGPGSVRGAPVHRPRVAPEPEHLMSRPDVMACDVMSGDVMSRVIMSCHVISCRVIRASNEGPHEGP